MYTFFRKNFFLCILSLLIFVIGVFSYFRFMILNDYMVSYEGFCDPATEECFFGCEDEECEDMYYFTKAVKYAPDLYEECGEDITDCENADVCLPGDYNCSITYCDPEIDGEDACETETGMQDEERELIQLESSEDDNIINNDI